MAKHPVGDFKCSECGQEFTKQAGLTRHMHSTHGSRKEERRPQIPRYCPGCGTDIYAVAMAMRLVRKKGL